MWSNVCSVYEIKTVGFETGEWIARKTYSEANIGMTIFKLILNKQGVTSTGFN
jgi:hypothetical protein